MKNRNITGSICWVAALYMFYTAYQLFRDRNINSSMSVPVCWIFIIFFAAAGVGLTVIGYRQRQAAMAEEKERKDNESLK